MVPENSELTNNDGWKEERMRKIDDAGRERHGV
jgi:hypothetical protein